MDAGGGGAINDDGRRARLLAIRRVTVAMSKVRGLRRAAGAIRVHFARRGGAIRIGDYDGDCVFHCELGSHIGSQIFWHGMYSRDSLRILDRLLKPDHVFLDIGANEGEHTVFAAKRLTKGRVVAFEPSARIYARLLANIEANGFGNVLAVPIALSSEAGVMTLYASSSRAQDKTVNEGLGTLYARNGGAADLREEVRVMTLDEVVCEQRLTRIDWLKVDVEGSELAVLRGGVETLTKYRPRMILEVEEETARAAGHTTAELLALVRSLRYTIWNIGRGGKLTPMRERPSRDVLCVPDEQSV